ncbi:hypothetical protein ACFQI3_02015 [Hansschlegelia quercus]|uniref:Uncharacterized protein n=1 Tax=Hansschlegelia quercus TaxID=2528245 RepID=A0A4Q9GKA2_9HYPH|nr:hypothetical protein [Hansschlegelia quercus]TBN54713.1 hypothetical protein EYR15_00655 [Hansschlegelia quercus]
MHIVNLHQAPPSTIEAALTYAAMLHHTQRLDELNFAVEQEIAHHRLTRARLEDTIERLIAALDADDGDPDREPSLCGLDVGIGRDDELELAEGDDEPSLGWTRSGALGTGDDREDVNEDGDPLDQGEHTW